MFLLITFSSTTRTVPLLLFGAAPMSWVIGAGGPGPRTRQLHAVPRADQPPPHRQADVTCTQNSDFHCVSQYLSSTALLEVLSLLR